MHSHDGKSGILDQTQDWVLINTHENETHTVLEFIKSTKYCNPIDDFAISEYTDMVIWALNENDIDSSGLISLDKVKHHGEKKVKLLNLKPPKLEFDNVWNLQPNRSIEIPF